MTASEDLGTSALQGISDQGSGISERSEKQGLRRNLAYIGTDLGRRDALFCARYGACGGCFQLAPALRLLRNQPLGSAIRTFIQHRNKDPSEEALPKRLRGMGLC